MGRNPYRNPDLTRRSYDCNADDRHQRSLTPEEVAFIARADLTSFVALAFQELNPGQRLLLAPHIEVLATYLERVRRGECRRLVVLLPPRHLKSHTVSIAFPAFILGHDPTRHVLCASYGQVLANELAAKSRRLMQSTVYRSLFGEVLGGRQSVDDFETSMGGRRLSTSVGGALTGRGADVIIIDDPQKADEALSEASRNAVHTWYDNSLQSRLNNKMTGAIIIVMQRLHQDDLVGHVLEQEDWEVLSLPAIATEDEQYLIQGPLGRRLFSRKAGDILHPEREDGPSLTALRRSLGEFSFSAQYQQMPIPLGGSIVRAEWILYYDPADLPPRFSWILQSWDTANKAGELNDYSVCTTWGYYKKHLYLLHVSRKRLTYPELKREVSNLARQFNPRTILIEDKASGTQLIQDLKADGVPWVKAYEPPPATDKVMRLRGQTALFENGFVHLPRAAPWLAEYIAELMAFPGSKYDDQVDSTTQALDHFHSRQNGSWMGQVDWDSVNRQFAQMPPRRPKVFF